MKKKNRFLDDFWRFLAIFGHFWPISATSFWGFPLWPLWETQNFNIGEKKNPEPFFCISRRYSYFEGFFFEKFFFDFFFLAKSFLGFSPLAPMARRRLLSGR